MATDGYHIFFNPQWVSDLPAPEIEGVIAHEVLHVVFGHSDRLRAHDPDVWNLACDHAINLFLLTQGFALPMGGAMDNAFTGMTAEEIYDCLYADMDRKALGWDKKAGGESAEGRVTSGSPDQRGSVGRVQNGGIGRDILAADDIRIRDLQDHDALDAEERRQLRRALGSEMRHKLHGTGAGFFEVEFARAKEKVIDWELLLRRWLFERIRSDWRTFPFSKKHLARGFFMPSLGLDIPSHVVFAIDTSGSMGNEDLAVIAGEVRNFRETFPSRLTVLQCDASIQREETYSAEDPTPTPEKVAIKGRGGTDFRPVFKWVSTQTDTSYPILIYATDGYGSFPQDMPAYPCIWVLTPTALPDKKIPFGTIVRLPRRTLGMRAQIGKRVLLANRNV